MSGATVRYSTKNVPHELRSAVEMQLRAAGVTYQTVSSALRTTIVKERYKPEVDGPTSREPVGRAKAPKVRAQKRKAQAKVQANHKASPAAHQMVAVHTAVRPMFTSWLLASLKEYR